MKITTTRMLVYVTILGGLCFVLSCGDSKGKVKKQKKITPSPQKQPIKVIQPGESASAENLLIQGSFSLEPDNTSYSPGNKEWKLPTQEEQDKWDHKAYVVAIEKWAKSRLVNWYCQTCRRKLNEEFRFLDRNGRNIRFKCKCNCGHEHTITLRSN